MKKLSILLVSVLTLGLSFTSCNSDDDKENDTVLLVGKWIPTKIGTIEENGTETYQVIPNAGKCNTGLFEYLQDGTFTSLRYELEDGNCIAYNKKGTWILKDKTLTSVFDDGPVTLEILELNKSTLKLKQSLQFNETSLVLLSVYNRK